MVFNTYNLTTESSSLVCVEPSVQKLHRGFATSGIYIIFLITYQTFIATAKYQF